MEIFLNVGESDRATLGQQGSMVTESSTWEPCD